MASSGLASSVENSLDFLGTAEWQPPNQNPSALPQSPQRPVETHPIRTRELVECPWEKARPSTFLASATHTCLLCLLPGSPAAAILFTCHLFHWCCHSGFFSVPPSSLSLSSHLRATAYASTCNVLQSIRIFRWNHQKPTGWFKPKGNGVYWVAHRTSRKAAIRGLEIRKRQSKAGQTELHAESHPEPAWRGLCCLCLWTQCSLRQGYPGITAPKTECCYHTHCHLEEILSSAFWYH